MCAKDSLRRGVYIGHKEQRIVSVNLRMPDGLHFERSAWGRKDRSLTARSTVPA